MYKINSNNEKLQIAVEELLEWYDEYLDKDLRRVLEKLRDTKPNNLTDYEGETIIDFYENFKGLKEELEKITKIMKKEKENK